MEILKKLSDIVKNAKHFIFIIFYILMTISTSVNMIYPLHLIKQIKIMPKLMTKIINICLIKYQAAINANIIYMSKMNIWIYTNKKRELTNEILKGSTISMSNHLSELDVFYIGALFYKYYPHNKKFISFAKDNVRYYPFIGWMLLASDTIFVQNRNEKPNIKQHEYIENKLNCEDCDKNILIFPEGTTYRKNVKDRREEEMQKRGAIIKYKNLLIPKTTGLYMIEKKIQKKMSIIMKIEGEKELEDYTMKNFFKGQCMENIHIYYELLNQEEKKEKLCSREEFDNKIYKEYENIDKILDQSTIKWKKNYKYEKLTCSLKEIFWLCIHLFLGIYTPWILMINNYYRIYFISASLFYIYIGYKEHNTIGQVNKRNE